MLVSAGAGAVAVFLFIRQGMDRKQAQANAVAVMLPTSLISLIIYFLSGYVNFNDKFFLIPTSVAGAMLGTLIFSRISPKSAAALLGAFMVFAGLRMLTAQ